MSTAVRLENSTDTSRRIPSDPWETEVFRTLLEHLVGDLEEHATRVTDYLGDGKYEISITHNPKAFDPWRSLVDLPQVRGWVALAEYDHASTESRRIMLNWHFDGQKEYVGGDGPMANALVILMFREQEANKTT